MSATIHYDFEACNKCVEQLFLFHDRWQTNRPKLPEMDGQGAFMNELREITEVLDMLHISFEMLAMESGKYIQQVATEIRAIDETAKESFVSE